MLGCGVGMGAACSCACLRCLNSQRDNNQSAGGYTGKWVEVEQ